MNIVTVSMADNWIDTHLSRWRNTIYRHAPEADVYLIMPYTPDDEAITRETAKRIGKHFVDIRLVKAQTVAGFSIFMDSLRANALRAFGLSEALYLDADVDVVADITDIPSMSPAAEILWTPNAVHRDAVTRALSVYGLPDKRPYIEPAVMYLRRDLSDEYQSIVLDAKIDLKDYLPGVNTWNVLLRKYIEPEKLVMLPGSYNLMAHAVLRSGILGDDAHIVHFCGEQMQTNRLQHDLSGLPAIIRISKDGQPLGLLDWGKPYEG